MLANIPIPLLIVPLALALGLLNYWFWKKRGYTSITNLITSIGAAYFLCYQIAKMIWT